MHCSIPPLWHEYPGTNRDAHLIRFVSNSSQPSEVEFAPSPASSSSSITSDPEPSYSTGYSMSGVQDLLLYTNNPRLNLPPYEERINCSSEEEQAQYSDWQNISDVMGLGITF